MNENGTEAAAATAIEMGLMAAAPPLKTYSFVADHPFMFAVVKNFREILFIGQVSKPEY